MKEYASPPPEVMRDPIRASRWFWSQREAWHALRAADASPGSDKQAYHEERRLHAMGYLRDG
jgi:hypothetical protein